MSFFRMTRRSLGALALAVALAGPAAALEADKAELFVAGIVEDLRGLVEAERGGEDGAAAFLTLLENKASIGAVGKFAVGRTWRDMTETQRADYQTAFRSYISRTYQKRFGEYAGEDIVLNGSVDAGRKGVLVKSTLIRPGADNLAVEWLVNDRSGQTLLSDIVFEGVSLAVTLRETFGAMIEKRGGDVDLFIRDLAASEGA